MAEKQDKDTNWIARVAFWLAIGAVVCVICACPFIMFPLIDTIGAVLIAASVLFAFLAFIAGVIAIPAIALSSGTKGYFRSSLAIFLAMPLLLIMLGSIITARARTEREKANTGLYNLRLLGKSIVKYTEDHNGYLPVAEKWCDLLMEHNKNLTNNNFRHPRPERFKDMDIYKFNGECQFAFNKNLSGMRLAEIPGDVVLIFEADGNWNLNGGSELLKTRYRDKHSSIAILSVGGTIERYWYSKEAIRKFNKTGTQMYYEKPRWKP